MMKNKFPALILFAALAAGCASAPSRFYNLNATAQSDGTPAVDYTVAVGPVTIPALVDRPQFTVQSGTNRIEIEEFNRWAAPLNDNIARVVAVNLGVLLGTPQVSTAPLTSLTPAYQVTIHVQRFESIRDRTERDAALLEAVWVVRPGTANSGRSGHTLVREPAPGNGFDALAAAHSRALAKLSSDIASAVRAEVDAKP